MLQDLTLEEEQQHMPSRRKAEDLSFLFFLSLGQESEHRLRAGGKGCLKQEDILQRAGITPWRRKHLDILKALHRV